MHSWGDDWPHWNELYTAERYIEDYVYKWSRCKLHSKEKWGMIRYSSINPPCKGCGFTISAPWTKVVSWSEKPIHPILFMWSACWLYHQWKRFGNYIFGRAVRKACKLYPNVVKEITADLRGFK